MTLSTYYFNVPLDQYDDYVHHIIDKLYGVKEGNFRLVRDRVNVVRLELQTHPQIPFINSLPETVLLNEVTVYQPNSQLVDAVGIKIQAAITDFLHPIGKYYSNPNKLIIHDHDLKLCIKQLARDCKISRFIELDNNRFIVHVAPHLVTALIKVINNTLVITVCNSLKSIFDIDDGYSPFFNDLNSALNKWKETGDITVPIHPPNYV